MARILITSGPTRQYLDPVRYLTNASSGRMGRAIAAAVLELGHQAIVVSGPVDVQYPAAAEVIDVISTEQMLLASREAFRSCDGLIAAAAPCDYRPVRVAPIKISKTGDPLKLHLIETEDIVASLASKKGTRWAVGFALETEDHRIRALLKLERKCCDLIVSNSTDAINALDNHVEILEPSGTIVGTFAGPKEEVARNILQVIQTRLIDR
ncbi:MAG: phosphopantothenoylcysteine decarboxylase [Pirellulales bacterium]|nr:phosphopantothenoylcysteine decarboxylase [Pirellulales bacterium]